MSDPTEQDVGDLWQSRLNEAVHQFSLVLRELSNSNPWPENPLLEQAINGLATELWDRTFSQTEIRTAFENAIADLSRYAAGDEIRP